MEFKNMTVDENFSNLKNLSDNIDLDRLSKEEENLLIAINSAFNSSQNRLLERSIFLYECIEKEQKLIEYGITKYIDYNIVDNLLDKLNEQVTNDKMIFLCELEEFPRVIPKEVTKKIKWCKENNIFHSYYVLYTDYTERSKRIAKGEIVEKSKDPVLFGVFTKVSKDTKISYLSEKMYIIADWIDEYCDLTLDKLMNISPEVVKDIYSTDEDFIKKEHLEDLNNSEIGKAILERIKDKRKALEHKAKVSNGKNILNKLKRLFN